MDKVSHPATQSSFDSSFCLSFHLATFNVNCFMTTSSKKNKVRQKDWVTQKTEKKTKMIYSARTVKGARKKENLKNKKIETQTKNLARAQNSPKLRFPWHGLGSGAFPFGFSPAPFPSAFCWVYLAATVALHPPEWSTALREIYKRFLEQLNKTLIVISSFDVKNAKHLTLVFVYFLLTSDL